MSIPLYIITGFLGSGKTTFLKRLVEKYADDKKIGVIQNEFAPLNVDAVDVKRTGKSFQLLEVNRGSVFCVCRVADFKTGLRDFVDEHIPDVVFLEASGLSDPIEVAEILQAEELKDCVFLAQIWSIVDASTYLALSKVTVRLAHQVRVADVVIINKIDKTNKAINDEVVALVRLINPAAVLHQTAFCDVNPTLFAGAQLPIALRDAEQLTSYDAQGRPDIGTAVIKSTKKIEYMNLAHFLRFQITKAWRIKGHVQLDDGTAVMVQATFGDIALFPLKNYSGPTELVAIGPEIDPNEFSQQFRLLAG